MRKRILSMALTLCMILSLLPAMSIPAAATGCTYYVGTTPIADEHDAPLSEASGDGWTWAHSGDEENGSGTLTLTDAYIKGTDGEKSYGVQLPKNTTVVLNGNNTITTGTATSSSYGIYCAGKLTISGDGSLSAMGAEASSVSYGISAADIEITSGTVNAIAGKSEDSYGINGTTSVKISGSSTSVTAVGGKADNNSCGIYSGTSIVITGGLLVASSSKQALSTAPTGDLSTATLTGAYDRKFAVYGSSTTYSEGHITSTAIDCTAASPTLPTGATWEDTNSDGTKDTLTLNNVIINTASGIAVKLPDGAKLELVGQNVVKSGDTSSYSTAESFGVHGAGNLTISGSRLIALSGTAENLTDDGGGSAYSAAVYAARLSVEDASVVAIGGYAYDNGGGNGENSCGMAVATSSSLVISNSAVTSIGGAAVGSCSSYGMFADTAEISGTSRVIAMGGIKAAYHAPTTTDSGKTVACDGGTYANSGSAVRFRLADVSYTVTAPTPVTTNGITATATFDKTSYQAEEIVTATVTLTGTAAATGRHDFSLAAGTSGVMLTPVAQDYVQNAGVRQVTAGKDLTGQTNPLYTYNKVIYTFPMPSGDVDGFTLSNTFTEQTRSAQFENVTITGTVGSSMTPQNVTLALVGDCCEPGNNIPSDVTAMFIGLPEGLTAALKSHTDTQVVVTISGTPTAETSAPLKATIPGGTNYLDSNTEITTTENAGAKFNISAPTPTCTVTFNANGHGTAPTAITGVASGSTITAPDAPTASGYTFGGWYKEAGCTNAWTFASDPVTDNITLHAQWTANGGGSGSGGDGGISTPTAPKAEPIIVDNIKYDIGTKAETETTATVTVDEAKLQTQIESASESVVVPITTEKDTAAAQLVVKNVEDMAKKEMTLTVDVGDVQYNMPTTAVDTGKLLESLGATDATKVPVNVTIKSLEQSDVTVNNGELMLNPVEFTVTATYDGKTVELERFSQYVERVIEIPTGTDVGKITTAIRVEDGEHVPTYVYKKDGKWFAKINSLTNSTYTLIYNEESFADAKGQWYESVVNEMASRCVIFGRDTGDFDGGASITRAEFAAIVVRSLGLPETGKSSFTDVKSNDWFSGAVGAASEYGIILGYEDGSFKPNASITRQEAMAMTARAAKVAELEGITSADLSKFTDTSDISAWAQEYVTYNVANSLILGSDGLLRPADTITRAETATVILRLLQKAELVDVRTNA